MNLSSRTIQAVARVITGDGNMSPYRSGPRLVEFFNEYGSNSRYGQGFPSRWQFAEDELHKLNGTANIKAAIESAVDQRYYLDTKFEAQDVVEHLNQYLIYDGYRLVQNGLRYTLCPSEANITTETEFVKKFSPHKGSHAFILEQIDKCRDKLNSNDYDGAITNARTMVEAVFEELIKDANAEVPKHDGDLNVLFKAVKKNLNLDAAQVDLSETLKQMLSGLSSIVTGIAGISNKMGDRHARKYKPERHHALLAINTSYALCEFLLSSLEYQKAKGTVK